MSEKFLERGQDFRGAEAEKEVASATEARETSEAENLEKTYKDTAEIERGFLSKIAESTKSRKVRNFILALQVSSVLAAGAGCKTMSAAEMYRASVPTSGYIQAYKATQRQLIDERVWKEREAERMQGRIAALEAIKSGKYVTCETPIPGLWFDIGRTEMMCFHEENMKNQAYAESIARGSYDALINHFKIYGGR